MVNSNRIPHRARITRSLLSERATNSLRKLILRNVLAPGATVTEREISDQLGISRTPVREAIRTLIGEGLIIASKTGRLSIADPDLDTVVDLIQVLCALESLAAELAAQNASDAELSAIEKYHEQMCASQEDEDRLKYFDANISFHRSIVGAAHNQQLLQTHKGIDDRLYRARFQTSRKREMRARSTTEHERVVKALRARDHEAARIAMKEHLASAIPNLRMVMTEEPV